MRTRLILSRHGQTTWHRENRYAGVSDVDLTDTGREQAAALGEWSRRHRPDALYASPVRRAAETIAPAADATGLPVHTAPDLREVDFGVAEGRTLAELDPAVVAGFRADPAAHPFPGSEPPDAAARRGAAALRAIAAEHPGARVLVVAHNTLLRLALCALVGLPAGRYRDVFPRLDNGALSTIAVSADGADSAAIESWNVPIAPPTTRRT
ncbi:MAG TPA: histidine phosphatase family protein [Actinocatenispora sp.]